MQNEVMEPVLNGDKPPLIFHEQYEELIGRHCWEHKI